MNSAWRGRRTERDVKVISETTKRGKRGRVIRTVLSFRGRDKSREAGHWEEIDWQEYTVQEKRGSYGSYE